MVFSWPWTEILLSLKKPRFWAFRDRILKKFFFLVLERENFLDFLGNRVRAPRGATRPRDTVRPNGLEQNEGRMSEHSAFSGVLSCFSVG